MAELPPLDDAMRAKFAAAREADRIADLTEPRARDAHYDPETGRIVVELKLGGAFAFRPDMYPELEGRSPAELERVMPSPSGEAVEWEDLDVQIAVAGVLVRMLGPAMLRAFAQRGGSATSERKAAAARANGARGGRPRKRREAGWRAAPPGYGMMQLRETRQEELTKPESAPEPDADEAGAPSAPGAKRRSRKRPLE
ncbi:MAG TPA: DUF2442 domain-containing protein [Longimicrobium sp.]|nr:DUF2442 domain-containing protein [Longimicrobium sp.]